MRRIIVAVAVICLAGCARRPDINDPELRYVLHLRSCMGQASLYADSAAATGDAETEAAERARHDRCAAELAAYYRAKAQRQPRTIDPGTAILVDGYLDRQQRRREQQRQPQTPVYTPPPTCYGEVIDPDGPGGANATIIQRCY